MKFPFLCLLQNIIYLWSCCYVSVCVCVSDLPLKSLLIEAHTQGSKVLWVGAVQFKHWLWVLEWRCICVWIPGQCPWAVCPALEKESVNCPSQILIGRFDRLPLQYVHNSLSSLACISSRIGFEGPLYKWKFHWIAYFSCVCTQNNGNISSSSG